MTEDGMRKLGYYKCKNCGKYITKFSSLKGGDHLDGDGSWQHLEYSACNKPEP